MTTYSHSKGLRRVRPAGQLPGELPELDVYSNLPQTKDFNRAVAGSAQWIVLENTASETPWQRCYSQGESIMRACWGVLQTYATRGVLNLAGIQANRFDDAWRPALAWFAQTRGGLTRGSTLDLILSRDVSTWIRTDKLIVTAFLVWVAFYSSGAITYPDGVTIPYSKIALPPDATPLPMPGYPETFSSAAYAELPSGPDCVASRIQAGSAPTLRLTKPDNGSTITQRRPSIQGITQPGNVVSVTLDGGAPVRITADAQGAWVLLPTADLADGDHTLRATVTTTNGTADATVGFTIAQDASPPIAITSPVAGSTVTTARPTIAGTASPLARVQVSLDNGTPVEVLADVQGAWGVTPTADLTNDLHTALATTTAAEGVTGHDEIAFTVAATGAPAAAPFVMRAAMRRGGYVSMAAPWVGGAAVGAGAKPIARMMTRK